MIKHICKKCNTEYFKKPSIKQTSFCSRNCQFAFGKTKETIDKIRLARAKQIMTRKPTMRSGYLYIKDFSHPNCGKQGYVAIHRLVMEKHIGRLLTKQEVVHHINHDMIDNRIENLELFATRGQHTRIAHKDLFERQKIEFKGKHFSPKTEFRKGMVPWNKKV